MKATISRCCAAFARAWARVGAIGVIFALFSVALMPATTIASSTVRVGVLKFGTVHWELDTIAHHRLDAQHGVSVQVLSLASKRATDVALQGGAVDVIVSDWIWVSRQRAQRRHYTFVPYSLTVGALMVRPDVAIHDLRDLKNRRIGVAGGPLDKSWLLLRAYSRQRLGSDLVSLVEPNFAAPPVLNQLMLRGELPAVLNFWHYNARLAAAGMVPLISVSEMLKGLGVEAPVPLLGWVFSEQWAKANRDALHAFLDTSYAAKHLLLRSDDEWQRLRGLLDADDDATARALRDAYRQGVPNGFGGAEKAAAAQTFELLAREGGNALVGEQHTLSAGTFWSDYTVRRWPQ